MEKDGAERIGWREAHAQAARHAGFDAFARAVAMVSVLGSLAVKRDLGVDPALADGIARWQDGNGWFCPGCDGLVPAMEGAVAGFLHALGATSTTVYDEFYENRFEVPVARFSRSFGPYRLPEAITGHQAWTIHAADSGVLLAWNYDDVAAFIAMTDAARARADPTDHLECIDVADRTTTDWTACVR